MSYRGTLTIREIAGFIGKSEVFVRKSIENGSLPIGSYTREGKKASYFISPKRAEEWLGYKREENTNDDSSDAFDYFINGQSRSQDRLGNSLL